MSDDAIVPGSVHDLRRRWKPHKARLSGDTDGDPTIIRFHRATPRRRQPKRDTC